MNDVIRFTSTTPMGEPLDVVMASEFDVISRERDLLLAQVQVLKQEVECVRDLRMENAELRDSLRISNNNLAQYSMSAGQADQYRNEAIAVRKHLGFVSDAEDVSPSDLIEQIDLLTEASRSEVESLKIQLEAEEMAHIGNTRVKEELAKLFGHTDEPRWKWILMSIRDSREMELLAGTLEKLVRETSGGIHLGYREGAIEINHVNGHLPWGKDLKEALQVAERALERSTSEV